MRLVKRYPHPGTSPGTLRPPEARRVDRVQIRVMGYGPDRLEELEVASAAELARFRGSDDITWVDVVGLHEVAVIQELGELFGLHPLALEDVLNTGQRPKLERYEDCLFVILRLPRQEAPGRSNGEEISGLAADQISLFLGPRFVISFRESPEEVFELVRERIRRGGGRIRGAGSDYLCYALVDAVVDHFFPALERYGEVLEEVEEELLESPGRDTLRRLHRVKRDLLVIRRAAWPQRDVVNALAREEAPLVREDTRIYLRDCYDHAVQILDLLETYRELANSMLEVYLSSVSNRTNQIMKVLTIMASIFIPLTFVAGVYGMNFDPGASRWNMPELGWRWGYPAVMALMAAIVGVQLWVFRRKGWW
jgi:magnesium transporter